MKRRMEAYRMVYSKRILPAFPDSKERFENHFRASCELIRELPLVTSPDLHAHHPHAKDEKYRDHGLLVFLFSTDIALVALGLKPLALCEGVLSHHMKDLERSLRGSMMFFSARLEMRTIMNGGVEVYDPVLLSAAIKKAKKINVRPEQLPAYLDSVEYMRMSRNEQYPYYLLGYPEEKRKGRKAWEEEMELSSGSRGFLDPPRHYYISHFACSIYDVPKSAEALDARASAAALIEDIRGSPAGIESFAMIRSKRVNGGRIHQGVRIVRLEGRPGIWNTESMATRGESMPVGS